MCLRIYPRSYYLESLVTKILFENSHTRQKVLRGYDWSKENGGAHESAQPAPFTSIFLPMSSLGTCCSYLPESLITILVIYKWMMILMWKSNAKIKLQRQRDRATSPSVTEAIAVRCSLGGLLHSPSQ